MRNVALFLVLHVTICSFAERYSERTTGCCKLLAIRANFDPGDGFLRWLECIRVSKESLHEFDKHKFNLRNVSEQELKKIGTYFHASRIDSWRIIRCVHSLRSDLIDFSTQGASDIDIDVKPVSLRAEDLVLNRLYDFTSQFLAKLYHDGECDQHQVLYDIRTIMGTRPIQYTEIKASRGISTFLMLQHPYSTSILSIGQSENQHQNSTRQDSQYLIKDPTDFEVLRDLQEQDFQTDILFLDGDHTISGIANDFFNYHDFVRPGGFVIFDDYTEDVSGLQVPAFVDELISKLFNHGWSYYDVWGKHPADAHCAGSGKVFILYRNPDEPSSPLLSNFIINFYGRHWDKLMGISRASFPPPRSSQAAIHTQIHFAVVISFFYRDFDPLFIIPQSLSLTSLASQTFPHWTLIAVGDGLSPAAVADLLTAIRLAGIPPARLRFHNMDPRFREETLYRNRDSKFDWDYARRAAGAAAAGEATVPALGIWKCAGTNALNIGLDMAEAAAEATHVARLDEDDVWSESHLENLARAYEWAVPRIGRTADFAYTQGSNIALEPFFPDFNRSGEPEWVPPLACYVIHAATSWDQRRLPLRYRLLAEQAAFPTAGCGACDYDCDARRTAGQAVDADMWVRVEELVYAGRAASVFYPVCDVRYTNESKKARIKALLAAAASPDEARAAVGAIA